MRSSAWAHLLEEDADFKRWFDNLSRGSRITAFENARILYRFLKFYKMTPMEFAEYAKRNLGKVEDQLLDFVTKLHSEGKAPAYIDNYLKAVRSWLSFNGVRLVRRIKIGNRNITPSIANERVPTADELRQILTYAGERAKCSISLMAMAGLRPEVLGNMDGTDGLMIGDLPELAIEGDHAVFTKTPTMVVVRIPLSKAKHKYFTFLSSEGCDYLKAYLEKRLAMGEKLVAESPVIAVAPGYENTAHRRNSETKLIATKNVTREIREAIRPRFRWRPYVLRCYFDTQLLVAENHGKISHAYRVFFMGHKGDMEARYTTNKGRLTEELIEDMRESYRRCQEYLQTTKTEAGEEQIKQAFKKQLLLVAGFKHDEIDKMDLSSMTDEEFQATVRQRLLGAMVNNGAKQKVIGITDVEHYITEGWEYVDALPGDKAIIRLPN